MLTFSHHLPLKHELDIVIQRTKVITYYQQVTDFESLLIFVFLVKYHDHLQVESRKQYKN